MVDKPQVDVHAEPSASSGALVSQHGLPTSASSALAQRLANTYRPRKFGCLCSWSVSCSVVSHLSVSLICFVSCFVILFFICPSCCVVV